MTRKILYSPNYGAGWTSWESDIEMKKFMLTYQPIIDYLEAGSDFKDCDALNKIKYPNTMPQHPINPEILPKCLQQFIADCIEKFGRVPGLGGARDLVVEEVNGLVLIDDFDGNENIEPCYKDYI
jgi:hypothetical protein